MLKLMHGSSSHTFRRGGFVCIVLCVCAAGRGQPIQEPPPGPSPQLTERLDRYRSGIVDQEARPVNRRRWAEELLSVRSPFATKVVIELLALTDNPTACQAICVALAGGATTHSDWLDTSFIGPLLTLLDTDSTDLRTQAGKALAAYPGFDVPAQLVAIAGDTQQPLRRRLAAVDALAPDIDQRDVVDQLIRLFDAQAPEITKRVIATLEPATDGSLGQDPQSWRRWWTVKSRLGDREWLGEQLRATRIRLQRATEMLASSQRLAELQQGLLSEKIGSFQRDLYRLLTADQRNAKLAVWLDDSIDGVQTTALAIIRGQIADEGKRPAGDVLAALLKLLKHGSPVIRRDVLGVVQNLKDDPGVFDAVLARIGEERDPATRHALFKAIGKFVNLAAAPAMVREIAEDGSAVECVAEAAIALGLIAEKQNLGELHDAAVVALRKRFRLTDVADADMRGALLTAMAGVASESFTPTFLEAVESEDPRLLRPAIEGLRVVRDTSKLVLLRTRARHGDPAVRRAALAAIGELGGEEADIESLLGRLGPSNEQNQLVRQTAWDALREILYRRPVHARIEFVQRLRAFPEHELLYLAELADTLTSANGDADSLDTVLNRLASLHVARGDHASAVTYLRDLYRLRTANKPSSAADCGLQLLRATLRTAGFPNLAAVVAQLAASAEDDVARSRIILAVSEYVDLVPMQADRVRTLELLKVLQTVSVDDLGPPWQKLLSRIQQQIGATSDAGNVAPPAIPGQSEPQG